MLRTIKSPPNNGVTQLNNFGKNQVDVSAYKANPVKTEINAIINKMRYENAATLLWPILLFFNSGFLSFINKISFFITCLKLPHLFLSNGHKARQFANWFPTNDQYTRKIILKKKMYAAIKWI